MNNIEQELDKFFHKLSIKKIESISPLVNESFPGDFNVSGFHKEVDFLSQDISAFWGVDRCLRIQEQIDEQHSYLFHMLIYAKSQELTQDNLDPFTDKRFLTFQNEIIDLFVNLVQFLNINPADLEATYYGGGDVGGYGGRDKLLKRSRYFPADINSKNQLERWGVKPVPVLSLDNIDIRPIEGALVGPRVEVMYQGVELATLVFDCFKLKDGQLQPMNYVGGFAIGMERLETLVKGGKEFLETIPRYEKAKNAVGSSSAALKPQVRQFIFAQEALRLIEELPELSKGQKELVRQLRKKLNQAKTDLSR